MFLKYTFLICILTTLYGCEKYPIYPSDKWGCQQMIVVKTADMNAVQGQMIAYDWSSEKREWVQASETIPMVVGYKGSAWGKGLHAEKLLEPPFKREGDRKSPVGIFYLSSFFGYEAGDKLGVFKMPYIQADASIYCVDDPLSKYYNRIVDTDSVQKDWQSAERMVLDNDYYKYGVVVDYNYPKSDTGKGSCIFLHVWRNAQEGTFGCTAVAESKMKQILLWLDIAKKPILVQAPEHEYAALKKMYFLP
jgi:L,D-peptidoglycan transpeptidase YkuD (ErfK/YbiS/YcfS/YnhG family)